MIIMPYIALSIGTLLLLLKIEIFVECLLFNNECHDNFTVAQHIYQQGVVSELGTCKYV